MSRVLTAKDICTRALRAIGAFPITDTAPDSAHVVEAMRWLDMLLAETVGTQRMFSRVEPGLLSFDITNGTGSYDLYAVLGADLPADGIEFVIDAWVEDDNSNRYPLEIVNKEKFESVRDTDEEGRPVWLHLDANIQPTVLIRPVPATTDSNDYTVKLAVQKYAPDVAPGGVTGALPLAAVLHEFGQAWQRWMVVQLAHDIGSGPVYTIEESRLNRFAGMAMLSKDRLDAYKNRTHETTPPVCEAWQ